jgi:hypothetical protein
MREEATSNPQHSDLPHKGYCKLKVVKGGSDKNTEFNSTYSTEKVEEAAPLSISNVPNSLKLISVLQ